MLVVLGPTGTGKSELAYRVARAVSGEIVGCDALQVYRGLDLATAKPAQTRRTTVPHHLIDCVDPRVDFSMAQFVERAEQLIEQIVRRDRVPIVAGGTGLYLRALLRGVVPSRPRDPKLRMRIRQIGCRHGSVALHRWLRRLDPESADRLPPADTQRVARAIEYSLQGGGSWSEQLKRRGTWGERGERFATLKIGLSLERSELYTRLEQRVDRFFDAGLVDEVRALLASGVPEQANALKGIGYREVLRAILRGTDPDAVRDEVKSSTRRYAKRQMTWFRREDGVQWLDVRDGEDALLSRTLELWDRPCSSPHGQHE